MFTKNSISGGRTLTNVKPKTSCVSGRLVSFKRSKKYASSKQKPSSQSPLSSGFYNKQRKSQLQPTQHIVNIGGLFDLEKSIVMQIPDRVQKIRLAVTKIMSAMATAKEYLHKLGLMASCIDLIPFARLHMRQIQLHLLHFWKPVSRDLEAKIPSSQHLKEHLNWWLQPVNMHKGRSLQPVQANLTIATDASTQC